MAKEIKNIAASVKERLRKLSAGSGNDYQFVLRQFIQERFLYRLAGSIYSNNLILKGALLFIAHNMNMNRPTRDIDFLGSSISNDKEEIKNIVKEIIQIDSDDGLRYDSENVEVDDIDEDGEYKGVRVKFNAYLENSRQRIQIDVGFGDKIVDGPVEIEFPTLLDFPAPKIKVYSVESAVAEKFEAIVSLMLQTSRMKDFYDILFFSQNYRFDRDKLREAINTTFSQRGTNIELCNKVFADKFKTDEQLQRYWTAFLTRTKLIAENNFAAVVTKISAFIIPVFESGSKNIWNCKEWVEE